MKLKENIFRIKRLLLSLEKIDENFDQIKFNQGLILSNLFKEKKSLNMNDYEFKVFSQWGEDGIIQFLIRNIEIKNKTFIEFGVENFLEANCRFLLMKDNWQGFIIDGSSDHITSIRNSYFYWKYDLRATEAFITKDNVNQILKESNFNEDLGILSIDIDGNDWHILNAINFYKPRILICEYNDVFGPNREISVPYEDDFCRTKKHSSNLYFGASITAFIYLAEKKGYEFIGVNSNRNNAFFVRKDLTNNVIRKTNLQSIYAPSHIRESRNSNGQLSYLRGGDRLTAIKGLPVINVITNHIEAL